MKGPSLTVDTEAASSLSAVFLGAEGVMSKGRGVVNPYSLSGGVAYWLAPWWIPQMQATGLLSKTGRCLSFDESADGSTLGDGVGFLCLKQLTKQVDGEPEYVTSERLDGIIA